MPSGSSDSWALYQHQNPVQLSLPCSEHHRNWPSRSNPHGLHDAPYTAKVGHVPGRQATHPSHHDKWQLLWLTAWIFPSPCKDACTCQTWVLPLPPSLVLVLVLWSHWAHPAAAIGWFEEKKTWQKFTPSLRRTFFSFGCGKKPHNNLSISRLLLVQKQPEESISLSIWSNYADSPRYTKGALPHQHVPKLFTKVFTEFYKIPPTSPTSPTSKHLNLTVQTRSAPQMEDLPSMVVPVVGNEAPKLPLEAPHPAKRLSCT